MESLIVKGRISAMMPKREGGQWSSQQFVVEETEGQYPKKVVFDVLGEDKIALFDLHVGDNVQVFLNISAKEWNGRWYNNVMCWRVNKEAGHIGGQGFSKTGYQQPQQPVAEEPKQTGAAQTSDISDLPF